MAVTTLCLAALAVTGWFVFGGSGPSDKKPGIRRYTHMHCPACGDELSYLAAKVGKPCEACVAASPYVPTAGSVKDSRGGSLWVRGIAFLAGLTIALEALAYFWVLRFRALIDADKRERNRRLICPCPFCSRKISYPVAKAGTGVLCSGCKTAFSLASIGEAEVEVESTR